MRRRPSAGTGDVFGAKALNLAHFFIQPKYTSTMATATATHTNEEFHCTTFEDIYGENKSRVASLGGHRRRLSKLV